LEAGAVAAVDDRGCWERGEFSVDAGEALIHRAQVSARPKGEALHPRDVGGLREQRNCGDCGDGFHDVERCDSLVFRSVSVSLAE